MSLTFINIVTIVVAMTILFNFIDQQDSLIVILKFSYSITVIAINNYSDFIFQLLVRLFIVIAFIHSIFFVFNLAIHLYAFCSCFDMF